MYCKKQVILELCSFDMDNRFIIIVTICQYVIMVNGVENEIQKFHGLFVHCTIFCLTK
jgi:hypothetical protein